MYEADKKEYKEVMKQRIDELQNDNRIKFLYTLATEFWKKEERDNGEN